MSGGAGKINKPRTALCKVGALKRTREKFKSCKRKHSRSDKTLANTTEEILRQCRTNPKANVLLSGKKKRLLRKNLKQLAMEKTVMEITKRDNEKIETSSQKQGNDMDTT